MWYCGEQAMYILVLISLKWNEKCKRKTPDKNMTKSDVKISQGTAAVADKNMEKIKIEMSKCTDK